MARCETTKSVAGSPLTRLVRQVLITGGALLALLAAAQAQAQTLPRLTLTKVSNGGVGVFSFIGSNGWASQTITTTVSGVGVAGATQTLAAASTSTTITQTAAPGFVLTGATCTGLGPGGTASHVGNTLTLDAAATAPGANIACALTSTRLPRLTLTKLSNGGVGSFTFTGSNGWSSQTIATTVSGVGVPGATQSLAAASTTTTITEVSAPGFVLTGTFCTGLGVGGTATRAGNALILDAAATAPGTNIACTFTSTRVPTLTLTQVSIGAPGAFTYTGTNGWASQTITTTTPGVAATGATQALAAAGTTTTISQPAAAGFVLLGAACTGLGTGGTATLQGSTLTLDAAATAANAHIACTFTHTRLPTLTLTKVSEGGTGTFTFTGGNGWVSQTISTSTPGVAAVGARQTLAAASTSTAVSELAPPGFVLTSATCTGMGSGGVAVLQGNTLTLNAAATTPAADIVCALASARLPTLTLTMLSNGGVGAFTFTGSNGWTAQTLTTAAPGVAVSGATQTLAAPSAATVITPLPPGGFVVTDAACTGLGAGGTARLSGNALTLDAAALAPGANIVCSISSARSSTLTVSMASIGGLGAFTFNGSNGWLSQTLVTTTPGVAVAGTPQTLAAPATATTISVIRPRGFTLSGASCTGLGAGGTAHFSGNTLTLDAAATAAGTSIACSFTSARLTTLTLAAVSIGGLGAFSFSGSNGWTPQTITTTTAGVALSGETQTLATSAAVTTITAAAAPGFVLTAASCSGLGFAGTATLAGNTLTLNAAATAPTSNITCSFTYTKLPTLTLATVSNGGVGAFTYSASNGWASQTLTTATAGVAVASAPQSLAAPSTASTVTQLPAPGFVLTDAACTGLGAGGGAVLAGNTLTLDTAATAPGANIVCTFNNAKVTTLALIQVSNGGAGAFTISGNKGWAPQNLTTATPGVAVSGATQTLAQTSTTTTLTQLAPPGFALTHVSCTGLGAGGAASFAGNTLTLNEAATAPGSNITCRLTSSLPVLSISDVTRPEGNSGNTDFTFTVSLSTPAGPGGVSFDIATADGSASAGTDYVARSLAAQSIPAGSSSYSFTVQVIADTLNEPDETFFVNITQVTGAVVSDAQGLATITNDDARPSLSIDDVVVIEGNRGNTNATFTVRLSGASGQEVSVSFETADGTAAQPADYQASQGTLNFPAGTTMRQINVAVVADTVPEPDKSFVVRLSNPVNASIAVAQGTAVIVDDDAPLVVGPPVVPSGAVGTAYGQTFTASGSTGPLNFALSAGALPAGLALSSSGVLAGTPRAGGTFNFTVLASSNGSIQASRAYSLTIAAATVLLPSTTLADGATSAPYAATITAASGGTAPYVYAVTAGALPGGLVLHASSGAITGTPSALGSFNFSVTATDSSLGTGPYTATQAYSIRVFNTAPVAANSALSVAYGAAATGVPLALSGATATQLAITTAPSRGTASISGTTITYQPLAGYSGPDSFSYTASNANGTSVPATVAITVQDPVITVTAAAVLSATAGVSYTQTFAFNGGAAPWAGYNVSNLPAGLAVTGSSANTVTVSGTPLQEGTFNLGVSASDSSTGNGPYRVSQRFALTVAGPTLAMTPAEGNLNAPYAGAFLQVFSASGGSGRFSYGVTGALPAGLSFSDNSLSGTPTLPGSYPITVTATDTLLAGSAAEARLVRAYTITVPAPTIVLSATTLPHPNVAVAYNQSLGASGGVAPYSFTVAQGALPPGLALASTGALSGTPSASGTYTFTVQATDAFGQSGRLAYTVVVPVPTLTITPATLPSGVAGTAYTQALSISGGLAPYTVARSGSLPAGLSFDAAARSFSGTPTQAGSFALSITVTDSTGGTAASITRNYTLNIAPPTLTLSPSSGALPSGLGGTAYSQVFTAANGIAPYSYAVSAGALPAGLVLNPATGALSGTPTVAGGFSFSLRATDSTGGTAAAVTNTYTLTLAAPAIVVTPPSLPGGNFGLAYQQALSAAGGTAPYVFTLSAGALPGGLNLGSTGMLSGRPSVAGSFSFTVTVTDAYGFRGSREFTMAVAERPDPSRDPEVRGLVAAQAESMRRYATSQISNFQRRFEQLHRGGPGRRDNGIALTLPNPCRPPAAAALGIKPCEGAAAASLPLSAFTPQGVQASSDASPPDQPRASPWGVWAGGTIRSGSQDGRSGGADLAFETDGLSLGVDYRFNPTLVLGGGLGYGNDRSTVGDHGSRVDSKAQTLALYASHHAGELFVDALLGVQRVGFDLRRQVSANGSQVLGQRDGRQWFFSLSLGHSMTSGTLSLTPYARLDMNRADLDHYTETGDAVYALHYEALQLAHTTGNLGLRAEWLHQRAWGRFGPQLRMEFQHDIHGRSQATLRYADAPTGPSYGITGAGSGGDRLQLGLGWSVSFNAGWSWLFEYRGLTRSGGQTDTRLGLTLQRPL
jgi:large repetitive protein